MTEIAAEHDESGRPWLRYGRGRKWLFMAALGLATASAAADRALISIVLEQVKAEFHLSDAALGLMAGSAFTVCLGLAGVPMGRWADRGNRRVVIAASMAVWSFMTMLTQFVGGFWSLFATRVGVGVGEAGAAPAAWSLVPDYFAPEQRPNANGVLTVLGIVGGLAAFMLGAPIAAKFGWRAAFLTFGLAGMALAPICWLLLDEPRTLLKGAAGPKD